MRRPVIAGNWKMYKTQAEARAFFTALKPMIAATKQRDIIIAPPFTALLAAAEAARGTSISVAAQDAYWEREGAFTGEVSMQMISDAGCRAVIIGHSERRQFFAETNDSVNRKLHAAIQADLVPIVCVGENIRQREACETEKVLATQFSDGLAGLTTDAFSRILIAYEPVWAIGTGCTATPEIASQAHRFIRQLAAKQFGEGAASAIRILYGGSVKPENIRGLMAQGEIDGALVGGGSLDAQSFAAIVNY